jgi:hypothetical protein
MLRLCARARLTRHSRHSGTRNRSVRVFGSSGNSVTWELEPIGSYFGFGKFGFGFGKFGSVSGILDRNRKFEKK